MDTKLDQLLHEVLSAAKYRHIDPDLVRRIGLQVLRSTPQLKAAVKETKSRLHQSAAAYARTTPHYAAWLAQLEAVLPYDQDVELGDEESIADWRAALKPVCLQIMAQHASTNERIPHLQAFYQAVFAELGPIAHILDLGCGLNPLALPWIPLSPTAHYDACDVFSDMMSFIGSFLNLLGQPGQALVCDLTQSVPKQRVDCVLALKLLPVLEQLERGAALRLLQQLQAPQIIVSYPTQSLGGRSKGMAANYERQLMNMLHGQSWGIRPIHAPGELVFLIEKGEVV